MSTKKIDIEKLTRNSPEYPEEFFSEMQKNVFDKIAKSEEETNLVKKKRIKIIKFTGMAASIALVVGIYLNVRFYDAENELSDEFNFYGDFISNQETNSYIPASVYIADYDGVLSEFSSQELDEEVDKYEIVTYLDYY